MSPGHFALAAQRTSRFVPPGACASFPYSRSRFRWTAAFGPHPLGAARDLSIGIAEVPVMGRTSFPGRRPPRWQEGPPGERKQPQTARYLARARARHQLAHCTAAVQPAQAGPPGPAPEQSHKVPAPQTSSPRAGPEPSWALCSRPPCGCGCDAGSGGRGSRHPPGWPGGWRSRSRWRR